MDRDLRIGADLWSVTSAARQTEVPDGYLTNIY